MNCNFNKFCGKLICDKLLKLQFIKGLRDTGIRTRLKQKCQPKPFKEIIDTASY